MSRSREGWSKSTRWTSHSRVILTSRQSENVHLDIADWSESSSRTLSTFLMVLRLLVVHWNRYQFHQEQVDFVSMISFLFTRMAVNWLDIGDAIIPLSFQEQSRSSGVILTSRQ
jgi:hypothetical protein